MNTITLIHNKIYNIFQNYLILNNIKYTTKYKPNIYFLKFNLITDIDKIQNKINLNSYHNDYSIFLMNCNLENNLCLTCINCNYIVLFYNYHTFKFDLVKQNIIESKNTIYKNLQLNKTKKINKNYTLYQYLIIKFYKYIKQKFFKVNILITNSVNYTESAIISTYQNTHINIFYKTFKDNDTTVLDINSMDINICISSSNQNLNLYKLKSNVSYLDKFNFLKKNSMLLDEDLIK